MDNHYSIQMPTEAKDLVRSVLIELGYDPDLIVDEYKFADLLSGDEPLQSVTMAAFSHRPPSLKTACLGVVVSGTQRPTQNEIASLKSLGAPMIFSVHDERVDRWRVAADGPPTLIETLSVDAFKNDASLSRKEWSPTTISRAKSLLPRLDQTVQLDFFDELLIPEIESVLRTKLETVLERALSSARLIEQEHSDTETPVDEVAVYQLVFRLLNAKMLCDRGMHGFSLSNDVGSVLRAMHKLYFEGQEAPYLLSDQAQQAVWKVFSESFSLNNVSVDTLAYIYEDSFVSQTMRKQHGIHGTPSHIARYIVASLNIETIEQSYRTVFEPFAGHGVFLIASLERLREMLPAHWSTGAVHDYLKNMLSGMELDPFAVEIARLSLTLADFPNTNGWNIEVGDVFAYRNDELPLSTSSIILANPPYEDFHPAEKTAYSNLTSSNKAVEAVHRILDLNPKMIGMLLPASVIHGRKFSGIRKRLKQKYSKITTIILPETAFRHSRVETVILMGQDQSSDPATVISIGRVDRGDYPVFASTGRLTDIEDVELTLDEMHSEEWVVAGQDIWRKLDRFPKLGDFAHAHRGVEFRVSLRSEKRTVIAEMPKAGFVPGIATVDSGFHQYGVGRIVFINTQPNMIKGGALHHPWSMPKVLVNAARKSRNGWVAVAASDDSGLVATQRFHGVWPRGSGLDVEVIEAVVNSPIANAYISTHLSGHDIQVGDLLSLPFPDFDKAAQRRIVDLVRKYRSLLQNNNERAQRATGKSQSQLLSEIDDIVRQGYSLNADDVSQLERRFLRGGRPLGGSPDNLEQQSSCQTDLITEIERIGTDVYGSEGLRVFMQTRLPVFGYATASELIDRGELVKVFEALVQDFEGTYN